MKDSARERHQLDPHAERCIAWLCPHASARRRAARPVRGYGIGVVKRRATDQPYGYGESGDADPHTSNGLLSQGCRRTPSSQPLRADDTAQDYGSPRVWFAGGVL